MPLVEPPPHAYDAGMTTVKIELPEELARQAQELGLLSPRGLEIAVRHALKREAGGKLVELGREIGSDGTPAMNEEEIQAEIDAVRAARRAKRDAPGP